ncbi:sigma-70 family RNA polymerase sigma factor [Amycolatopsis japonica]|uniref:sigma-70 family RNA polymerase sigma factor n=1 Tax=Amycolatopsis japonica TaxID=208439 RepID=UPI003670C777
MSELAHAVLATDQKVDILIEESSLGTTGARQLRRRVSDETANKVVANAEAAPDPTEIPLRPGPRDTADALDTLLPAAIAGDRGAVAQVMAGLRPMVFRYCVSRVAAGSSTSSVATAEDLAQEILMSVLIALPRYQYSDGNAFLAYVFGIASHKAADVRRADARNRAEPVGELPDVGDEDNAPERNALADDRASRLGRLFSVLSAKQRDVLVLRVILNFSANEAGVALNMSPGQIRVTQHRALNQLRRVIKKDPDFWN